MTTKGKLNVNLEEFQIEWRIDNFLSLSYSSGEFYSSPTFLFADAYWCLNVYPNGIADSNSEGFISFYLYRKSAGPQMDLDCAFCLKNVDPKKRDEKRFAHVFIKRKKSYGVPCFISRSELKKRRPEFMPSNILTVLCNLKFPKSDEDISNAETLRRSDCYENLSIENISSHEKTYPNQSMICSECSKVIPLKEYPDQGNHLRGKKDYESLAKDYKKVLLEGKNYDLVIKVGDKELRAHRDILRARSRVFESMLNHNMAEENSGVVDVADCDPQAMELFLSYLYCGKVETLNQSNMLELYYIADKYDMRCLRGECYNFIKMSLSTANICEVLQLALNHSDNSLLEDASEFFMDNVLNIMRTLEWQSFLKDNSTVGNELLIKAFEKCKHMNFK